MWIQHRNIDPYVSKAVEVLTRVAEHNHSFQKPIRYGRDCSLEIPARMGPLS